MSVRNPWKSMAHNYETGVSHGMVYVYNSVVESDISSAAQGPYIQDSAASDPKRLKYVQSGAKGYAWNGLTAFNESPEGADANKIYADNIKYLTLRGAEDFNFGIEALAYPEAFEKCNGGAVLGDKQLFRINQQKRETFGFCCRTEIGIEGDSDYGYKLYIVYGATCSPSSKDHATINDSPDASTMSWDCETVPVTFTVNNEEYTGAKIEVTVLNSWANSTDATKAAKWAAVKQLEKFLYGSDVDTATTPDISREAFLPTPETVYKILEGTLQGPIPASNT